MTLKQQQAIHFATLIEGRIYPFQVNRHYDIECGT